MKILTARQMRTIDRRATERYGVAGLVLMENAGRAVVEHLLASDAKLASRRVAVVCGGGNNGGDGLVVARHLHILGVTPTVFLLASRAGLEGDAAANLKMVEALPIPAFAFDTPDRWRAQSPANPLTGFDIVVDALFGTGLRGPLRGPWGGLIADINDSGARVVAVDLPSGLAADGGGQPGPAVRASSTVTFVAPKLAHVLPPTEEQCGEVVVARIGLPQEAVDDEGVTLEWVDEDLVAGWLAPRPASSHKGDFGHVLLVGGARGTSGAVRLAAEGVLRGGAGLVTAAVPTSIRAEVAAGFAPAMTAGLPESNRGTLTAAAGAPLRKLLDRKTVVAVGPGAGLERGTQSLLRDLVKRCPVPVVLDADGINAFAGKAKLLSGASRPLVLTPHPGEMARLLDTTVAEVQSDRIGTARALATARHCHVVLKGHRTVVASPDGRVFVNSTGNPGLATAGAGDVLTGLLAGLIATGLDVPEALVLGVYAHGRAADLAARQSGQTALGADLVLRHLTDALRELEATAA